MSEPTKEAVETEARRMHDEDARILLEPPGPWCGGWPSCELADEFRELARKSLAASRPSEPEPK